MTTISSMARNNYLMFQYAQNNGKSLFDAGTAFSKNTTKALLNSYMPSSSSIYSTMSGLMGIRSGMSDMVKSYDDAAKTFQSEFTSTMDDLSKASNALKGMNFDVGGTAAITVTTNEDGSTTTAKSDTLKDALKSIEDFASNYNDAIGFFRDNADVSKRMSHMADVFSDTTYRAGLLSQIGVVVGNDGKMKLDEDMLTKALTENPANVERILGKGGLAGKADNHVSLARSQQNRLFPSMASAMGGVLRSGSVYSGQSLLKLSSYSSIGNLLNAWI